ncbi:MAG: hypothetical protein LKM38_01540 [Pseudomonas veronii]|nr:hypothetical protein [Pseudomonas veronii]
MIRQLGYSRLQFRQMMTQQMLIESDCAPALRQRFRHRRAGPGIRPPGKTDPRFRFTVNIKADPAAVKLTDDEVKAYYDEHAKEFMTPDQVVIDYLELKKSSFFDQVTVKDEDLQAAYQKETANLVRAASGGAHSDRSQRQDH